MKLLRTNKLSSKSSAICVRLRTDRFDFVSQTHFMNKYIVVYAISALAMLCIDMVWLGVVAKSYYRGKIGHLMAAEVNFPAGMIFYLLFPIGIMYFSHATWAVNSPWFATFATGALFGFFAYATYDLTNLSTLRGWPVLLSMIDVGWGTLISGVVAVIARAVFVNI